MLEEFRLIFTVKCIDFCCETEATMFFFKNCRTTFVAVGMMIVLLLSAEGCSYLSNLVEDQWVSQEVMIDGREYDAGLTEFTVSRSDFADYGELNKFEFLNTLDLTALDMTMEDYQAIAAQLDKHPQIVWNVPFQNGKVLSSSDHLHITGDMAPSDKEALTFFTDLKNVTIDPCALSDTLYDTVQAVSANCPDAVLNYSSELYGVAIDNMTDTVFLNNIPIDDLTSLRMAIKTFPNITTYEMCTCGLSDEVMGGLREEYPDVKFVWLVVAGKYKLRTDAQVFSTLVAQIGERYSEDVFRPIFLYCTELRALDLGHHGIRDISEISHLTKLQTLILADNRIEDITPLKELKDLNYLEIFFNRVSDASPLVELENLEDLNFCYNSRLKNPLVLTQCKKLNRLYIANSGLSRAQAAELKAGLPENCEFNYTVHNAVHEGWRTNEKNARIREAFKRWKEVKEYNSWDNVVYE